MKDIFDQFYKESWRNFVNFVKNLLFQHFLLFFSFLYQFDHCPGSNKLPLCITTRPKAIIFKSEPRSPNCHFRRITSKNNFKINTIHINDILKIFCCKKTMKIRLINSNFIVLANVGNTANMKPNSFSELFVLKTKNLSDIFVFKVLFEYTDCEVC